MSRNDITQMRKNGEVTSPAEMSQRLSKVLSKYTLEEVVEILRDFGHETSIETVRRYREGLAKRIDSAFLAAVVAALGTDPAWLLMGPRSNEGLRQEDRMRAEWTLAQVAAMAMVGYLGPSGTVAWDQELWRNKVTTFLIETMQQLALSLAESADVLRDAAAYAEWLHEQATKLGAEEDAEAIDPNDPLSQVHLIPRHREKTDTLEVAISSAETYLRDYVGQDEEVLSFHFYWLLSRLIDRLGVPHEQAADMLRAAARDLENDRHENTSEDR